jgi:hypothetical protein
MLSDNIWFVIFYRKFIIIEPFFLRLRLSQLQLNLNDIAHIFRVLFKFFAINYLDAKTQNITI